jgi:DNA-binding SARP family transcriptional activator/tetratricopeptide (TPR) repeat protein
VTVDASHDIRLLGRFVVLAGGEEIPPSRFVGRLSKRLLRILAVHAGEHRSKDVLAEALWPERPPADPAANLEVLVARVRKGLGAPQLILTGPGGYALVDDPACRVDAIDVLRGVERGRADAVAGLPRRALAGFLGAVERWGGEPLPEDAYEEWAQEPRETIARAYQEALEGAAEASLEIGDPATAAELAGRAVARDPLRERGHLLLARSLAAGGDRAAALEVLAGLRGRLAEELGLDPSPELEELQGTVLRGDEVLPAAAPTGGGGAGPSVGAPGPAPAAPLVGRDEELRAIEEAGGPVLLAGPSGSGKTRLLDEAAARSELPVLRATAFLAERDEPWSLARSLVREALGLDALAARSLPDLTARALADVVPELAELRPAANPAVDARSRGALTAEGALQLLAAVAPAVAMVDDAQWADASSARLLGALPARVPGLRLVLATRNDQSLPPHIADVVADLGRDADARAVELGPLPPAAIEGLVANRPLARILAAETDGIPLSVLEALGELQERGLVRSDARGRWRASGRAGVVEVVQSVRTGGRRALELRIRGLDPIPRATLVALATFGREASAATLGAALRLEESVVLDALLSLAHAGLIRTGDRGWWCTHDAVGEAAIAILGDAERARAHAGAARALRTRGASPAEIAPHLAAAGDPSAADLFADAAADALTRFANGEAQELATAGLGLDPAPDLRARLAADRAEARMRTGDLEGAREDLRTALAQTSGGPPRARLLARMALLDSGSEDYERASDLVELALDAGRSDRSATARALAVGAIVDMNLGRLERSHERADRALAIFEEIGEASGAAGIMDGRAMATFLEGAIRPAEAAFDRVAKLFADAGELFRVGTPRSTRGHALVFLDRADEGLADAEEAYELARSLGHLEGISYAAWHRSEALAALGRAEDAVASAQEALAVAEELGHREWTAAALRALGIAQTAAGGRDDAVATFRRALEAAEGMPLFSAWAAARLAIALLASEGAGDEVDELVTLATATGTPLSGYEASWAAAELAASRGDDGAAAVADATAAALTDGGYLAAVPRLRELAAG